MNYLFTVNQFLFLDSFRKINVLNFNLTIEMLKLIKVFVIILSLMQTYQNYTSLKKKKGVQRILLTSLMYCRRG